MVASLIFLVATSKQILWNSKASFVKYFNHETLSRVEMTQAMRMIMTGETSPAQIGGF